MANKRTNYLLIDRENTASLEFGEMAGHPVKVLMFVSKQTKKLPLEEVKKMLAHPDKIQLIEMAGAGHNALDFHIAYYAGRIAAADPDAYIHIISKDTGFDPLIAHLRAEKIFARRSTSISELELLNAPDPSKLSLQDRAQRVIEFLESAPQSRPRKRKTLASSIHARFGKQLSEAEVGDVIDALIERGKIVVQSNGSVIYQL